jgi:hypothetical protein
VSGTSDVDVSIGRTLDSGSRHSAPGGIVARISHWVPEIVRAWCRVPGAVPHQALDF